MSEMVSFEEIKETPLHYINQLIENGKMNSYVLFMYGPYLAVNNSLTFIERSESIKSPLLKIIAAFALYDHFVNDKVTAAVMKSNIRSIIKNFGSNDPSDIIRSYGEALIEDIRKYQYENNVLESAMLNYAPIVPYKGTLVKPGMEDYKLNNISYEKLGECIENLLRKYPMAIIHQANLFINDRKDFANYLIRLSKSEGEELIARTYFALVFLKYTEDKNTYSSRMNEILNLNSIYNKIHNGEKIDMKGAMETFESLLTPSIT